MRILIAEDEQLVTRLLRTVLRQAGYDVKDVRSAAEAIAAIREEDVQLVLLDMHLADGTGLRVLEALAELRKQLPVVLMTGEDLEPDDPRIRLVSAVLRKPFDVGELEETVRRHIA
ncbi:MAG: response regulator [Chloroflexota bacterium]|jgi:DNA-binding response OmpR family regulator|nr:response regulator [Dehalococcoidia bacterium]MDW8046348.1 response regulator [Chloroflexota bacterium]